MNLKSCILYKDLCVKRIQTEIKKPERNLKLLRNYKDYWCEKLEREFRFDLNGISVSSERI